MVQQQTHLEQSLIQTLADIPRYYARVSPHEKALTFEGKTTNWAELDAATDDVARALLSIAKPGERIAYVGKNSDEFFTLMFGIAKAGMSTVPIIWRLAPAEIAAIVTDSDAPILFVAPDQFAALDDIKAAIPKRCLVVSLQEKHDSISYFPEWVAVNNHCQALPDVDTKSIAWQLYTSGTTGKPKGVMLSHDNILKGRREGMGKNMAWYDWLPGDVSLVALPMGHVGGIGWGVVGLMNGAHTIVQREFSPEAVLAAIHHDGITKLFLVPTTLQMLLLQPNINEIDFSRLRHVLYGAAPIALDLLREATKIFGCGFCQQYGATETCGTIVYLPPEDHDVNGNPRMRAAGLPMPGVEIRIVSPDDRKILGPHQVGEVETRSAANMVGYWMLPEETARTLSTDGWLRTGDAGYVDEDGYLYIYDRFKDMICTGAENVYPAEVESAIYGHPAVQEVAVIGVPDDKWGESVKAIIVPKPGIEVDPAEIIAFARTRIAGFKVPKSIDIAESLPRSPSGKILRRMLRDPFWVGRERRVN